MAGVRSLIDLYPLSSYVDWAAKRNCDPILDVFKQLFRRPATPSNSRAAAARISTISRRISRTSGFNLRLRQRPVRGDPENASRERQRQCLGPRPYRPRQAETWPDATSHRYDVIFAINLFSSRALAIAET